jgi:predicted ATPase
LTEVIDEKWGPGGVLLWRGLRGGIREVAYHGESHFSIAAIFAGDGTRPFAYFIGVELANSGGFGPRVESENLYSPEMIFGSDPPEDPPVQKDTQHLSVRFRRGGKHRRHGPVRTYLSSHSLLSQVTYDEKAPKEARSQVHKVVESLREMRFLDLTPDVMREASPPGHRVLGDRGENLSSVLHGIVESPRKKDALIGWLSALTPMDVRDLTFKEDFQGRVLVHLVEANGIETPAHSASDGTLRFLALTAALLGSDPGGLFFFEEIDNGIHPTRLHVLLDVLEQASAHMDCQIIATTHNPQLLAFLSEKARQDAVLLYRLEDKQTADAIRIMDLPDIERILEKQDLGHLFASGWLEDVVEFQHDDAKPKVAAVAGT